MPRLLLSHNPGYWPSIGGSEYLLQRILEGVRDDFEHVVVFANVPERFEHNGVSVRPYSVWEIRRFAIRERPDVYFPNMIHNRITYRNIAWLSRLSSRTVLNAMGGLLGGYLPGQVSTRYRFRVARRAGRHADVIVRVDPLSVEWLIDDALMPDLPVVFIPQGLDLQELERVRSQTSNGEFLFSGNLFAWKQPDVFLRQLVAQAPELRFRIVASDSSGNAIEETVDMARSLPNVEVELGVPREEFLQRLARSAGVISTSSKEGALPQVMLEAGVLGVPFLSVCPGQNFAHFPHVEMFASVDDLVARLRTAGPGIREEKQLELRRARDLLTAEQYGWDAVITRYRSLFLDPLPAWPRSPRRGVEVKAREVYNRLRWR
jgi:glycosyltransferase involved in cell wall biosynthesis